MVGSTAQRSRRRSANLPATEAFRFTSRIDGADYAAKIAQPYAAPPPGGFPVIYVLDGGGYFGSFAESARLRSVFDGEIAPAVVVGIDYPGGDLADAMRRRYWNLTPTEQAPEALAIDRGYMGDVRGGGAGAFLEIIEREIKPRVRRRAPAAPGRDILFGHSLGGLFTLHVLFNRPEAFRTYLSLSPSIWWNRRVVLEDEPRLTARLPGLDPAPRVWIGVGGAEQDPPAAAAPGGPDLAATQARVREARMVDNARELAERLAEMSRPGGLEVAYAAYPGRSHMGAPWAALVDVLDFALPPDGPATAP